MSPERLRELAAICQRLAETQRNMWVPLTDAERTALREMARYLRTPEGSADDQ